MVETPAARAASRLRSVELRRGRSGPARPGRDSSSRTAWRSAAGRWRASPPRGCSARARSLVCRKTAAGSRYSAVESRCAPGTPIVDALGIEPDTVLDIAVEANRPDAMCMAGIARDLAARLELGVLDPRAAGTPDRRGDGCRSASVEVPDPDLCPRFTARFLRVTIGPSPSLVARRLMLAGMRPLNNVVDASNYVMLELGQPTHPYDLDRVAGTPCAQGQARPGEVVVTLDGVERT